QSQVALRETEIGMSFVKPALFVVGALLFVPPREISGFSLIRIAKVFPQNAGSVRKMNDVLAEKEIVLENVPNESTEKGDIAAGTDRHPDIGQRARARKSWIDMDDRRPAFLRFHDPSKTDRVCLRHGRALD